MEKYINQIVKECELGGLSQATRKAYIHSMKQFVSYFNGRNPEELGIEEIKNFLFYLRETKKLEGRSVNRVAAAIKFYYFRILERNWRTSTIPKLKEKQTIPTILAKYEVSKMIHALRNIKHKAMIMTLYSTGIRHSELLNLKSEDIDSKRMVINIRQGKGSVDRQAILSPHLLLFLRKYWRENKDNKKNYLFPSSKDPHKSKRENKKNPSRKMSHTALGYVVQNAAQVAHIKKKDHASHTKTLLCRPPA